MVQLNKLSTFTITLLIAACIGCGVIGYEIGKNSPCTQVESIDIRPMD